MPPFTGWYVGAENIGRLIDTQCPGGSHDMPMLPHHGQRRSPRFGLYMRSADGPSGPSTSRCSTSTATGCSHVAAFFGLGLFETFGLPAELPGDTVPTGAGGR